MRQRRVVVCLYLLVAAWIATVAGCWFVMNKLRRERPAFVDPVIWHEPYTGGEEQLQPDI